MKRDVSRATSLCRPVNTSQSQSSLPENKPVDDQVSLADALLEAMPQGAVIYSAAGPLKANVAFAEILGFATPAEFLGDGPRCILDLFIEQDRQRWARALDHLLAGRKLEVIRKGRAVGRGRQLIGVDCRLQPIMVGDERCILVMLSRSGVAADSRRRNEERFRKLVDAMPYGVAWTDLDGVVRFCNPAYNHMLGYEAGELMNVVVWDIILQDRKPSLIEFYESIMREMPTPLPNITQCRKKNGDIIDILYNWVYDKDENGQLIGFLAVLTDVTARLKIETELRDAKDISDRANQEKSRFLAAASHDLQQPLHSLSILLGLLQQPNDVEKQRRIVDTMELALDGAMDLLRSVLDMSKLEAGVIVPRLEDFDLETSFDQVQAELGPQITHKPVRFRLVKTSAVVHSDRMLLKSILHNLVSNALRYTSKGKILVGCRRQGSRLRIEVHDTGRGIPLEKQVEIFEEFRRLEGPDEDRQVYALGLGLSIVERTCQLLGYRIKLKSEVGRGSTFSFEVPLAAWAKKSAVRKKDLAIGTDFNPLAGRRILLIEDDFSTLAHTNMLLESWGCDCLAAGSIVQALNAAVRQTPDLILADYNLGGTVNGIMAAEKIRGICQEDIPVIIVTSDIKPEVVDETTEHGFLLLEKPASPGRLRALMTHYLQPHDE